LQPVMSKGKVAGEEKVVVSGRRLWAVI
jgi:hypothetical protein